MDSRDNSISPNPVGPHFSLICYQRGTACLESNFHHSQHLNKLRGLAAAQILYPKWNNSLGCTYRRCAWCKHPYPALSAGRGTGGLSTWNRLEDPPQLLPREHAHPSGTSAVTKRSKLKHVKVPNSYNWTYVNYTWNILYMHTEMHSILVLLYYSFLVRTFKTSRANIPYLRTATY